MAIPLEETGGDPYLVLLSEAYRSQQAATVRILRDRRGPSTISELMEDADARAHRCAEQAQTVSPPRRPLACQKGCHYCCWATVGVVAPEVIRLADELRGRLPGDALIALSNRASRRAQRLLGMERGEKLDARLSCALLRNGSCTAYQSRPLVCRWACSADLQGCLDHLVHRRKPALEMEDVRFQPVQEVWRGLRAGLRDSGLDGSLLALNVGLSIALTEPDVARRYLDGEPVFEQARLG